jgi:hypothetical protein
MDTGNAVRKGPQVYTTGDDRSFGALFADLMQKLATLVQ